MFRPSNKRIPASIAIGIILFIALLAGGIFAWRYRRIQKEITPAKLSEITVPVEPVSINILQKLTPQYIRHPLEPGDFYYYQINPDTQIIFKRHEISVNEDGFLKGDVILKRGTEQIFLLRDKWLMGPGGETFSVYSTNLPTIFLIKEATGDMGWYIINQYYLDLSKKEIVFAVKDDQGHQLLIEKNGLPVAKIDLKIDDQCSHLEQGKEKKAKIIGLTLNGKVIAFDQPIEIDCLNPGGIGPKYSPDLNLEMKNLNSNFSKLFFSLTGKKKGQEIWRRDFFIDFTEPNDMKIVQIGESGEKFIEKSQMIEEEFDIKQVNFVKLFQDNPTSNCKGFCLPIQGTKLKYNWSGKKYVPNWWEEVGKKKATIVEDFGISIEEFVYHDVDGDDKPEVILNIYGGGTGGNDVFRVFKLLDSGEILELKVNRGDTQDYPYQFSTRGGMGHFHFGIKNKKIIEYADVYKEEDPNCCPTGGKRFVVFQWNKNKKELVITHTVDVLSEKVEEGKLRVIVSQWDASKKEFVAIKTINMSPSEILVGSTIPPLQGIWPSGLQNILDSL